MIVDLGLLVLPVLAQDFEEWLVTSQTWRQLARRRAEHQHLPASIADAREEHATPPPWIANPIGILVLGLDDGQSHPSFCGDIYIMRKQFRRLHPSDVTTAGGLASSSCTGRRPADSTAPAKLLTTPATSFEGTSYAEAVESADRSRTQWFGDPRC